MSKQNTEKSSRKNSKLSDIINKDKKIEQKDGSDEKCQRQNFNIDDVKSNNGKK